MMQRPLDSIRLTSMLLVGAVVITVAACAMTDQPALPVATIFLIVVVVSGFSGLYRYADVGAMMFGSLAYIVLEQPRGRDGAVSWAVATLGLVATTAVVRLLHRHIKVGERRVRRAQEIVGEMSMIDQASALLKRRYGEIALEEEVARARRAGDALTLIIAEPDVTNDQTAGGSPVDEEQMARHMGVVIRDSLRATDRGIRLGPTLFAALLPATAASGAAVVAEKINRRGEQFGYHSLRCAAATFPDHAVSADELLAEAEAALRLARLADISVITPSVLHRVDVAT